MDCGKGFITSVTLWKVSTVNVTMTKLEQSKGLQMSINTVIYFTNGP